MGSSLQFKGLVHYGHGGKHGGIQADIVLETEASVLHLDFCLYIWTFEQQLKASQCYVRLCLNNNDGQKKKKRPILLDNFPLLSLFSPSLPSSFPPY